MLTALQGVPTSRRLALAAACLGASLMFSGVGVTFAVAAVVQIAVIPNRRRALAWFAPVGGALAVWYLAFGRFGNHPNMTQMVANHLLKPHYYDCVLHM